MPQKCTSLSLNIAQIVLGNIAQKIIESDHNAYGKYSLETQGLPEKSLQAYDYISNNPWKILSYSLNYPWKLLFKKLRL